MERRRALYAIWWGFGLLSLCLFLWGVYRLWPRLLVLPVDVLPQPQLESDRIVLRVPGAQLVGELARYQDELFAYLMFDYIRSRMNFRSEEVFITYRTRDDRIEYSIRVVLPNDIIRGLPRLWHLASPYPFLQPNYLIVDDRLLAAQRRHTETIIAAYNRPEYQELDQLSAKDVAAFARRFIRFKSITDPRILRGLEPVPHPLTPAEAQTLAEDIVEVARFYALPLEFFLGIGAMENNYMNVRGDLGRAVWKRRAEKGDVVLRRTKTRVLVLNEALGVWQITQQTLRYAHSLFLKDRRDYSKLPEHLRPPRDLTMESVDVKVLTTYAGLLFRNLLDRFQEDVGKAVGAYNGGPGNPNARYEHGVRTVAEYARTMLERAAALRGGAIQRRLQAAQQ